MINKQLRVCPTCYDKPSEFLRTIILPADPPPVWQPRPEPYLVDEVNEYWLRAPIGAPGMFSATGDIQAVVDAFKGLAPSFVSVSDVTVEPVLGRGLSAALSDVSDVAASMLLGIGITAALSDVSDLAAELTQVVPPSGVVRTFTDSFTKIVATSTWTETAADIGAAAADRLVFVLLSGVLSTDNPITSLTIGGISATRAVAIRRNNGTGFFILSEIWWAAVPTGTTADIVATYTGDNTIGGAVYRITGADTTTPINNSDTGDVASGNVTSDVTSGNDTVTLTTTCVGASTADAAVTITNNTEDVEFAPNIGVFLNAAAASRQDVTGPGAITITGSVSSDNFITTKTMASAVLQTP